MINYVDEDIREVDFSTITIYNNGVKIEVQQPIDPKNGIYKSTPVYLRDDDLDKLIDSYSDFIDSTSEEESIEATKLISDKIRVKILEVGTQEILYDAVIKISDYEDIVNDASERIRNKLEDVLIEYSVHYISVGENEECRVIRDITIEEG